MAWSDKLRVGFRSHASRRAYVTFLLKPAATQGQIETFLAALAAFTRGAVFHATRESEVMTATTAVGTSGPYSTHRDLIRLRVGHDDGSRSNLAIPCARETLLEEDGQTLDWTDGIVTGLIAAMEPIVVSDSGSDLAELQAGWRDYIKSW